MCLCVLCVCVCVHIFLLNPGTCRKWTVSQKHSVYSPLYWLPSHFSLPGFIRGEVEGEQRVLPSMFTSHHSLITTSACEVTNSTLPWLQLMASDLVVQSNLRRVEIWHLVAILVVILFLCTRAYAWVVAVVSLSLSHISLIQIQICFICLSRF